MRDPRDLQQRQREIADADTTDRLLHPELYAAEFPAIWDRGLESDLTDGDARRDEGKR